MDRHREAGGAGGGEELLGMDEAIRLLKTSRPTFYRWLREGRFVGVKAGRQWRFRRRDLELFLRGEPPQLDIPVDMKPLGRSLAVWLPEAAREAAVEGVTSLRALVLLMLRAARQARASDVHLAPKQAAEGRRVLETRLRIDGVLHELPDADIRLMAPLVEQWKMLAACDPRERERPQDGRIMLTGRELQGSEDLDVRVSFLPTVLGEAVTARLLPRGDALISLDRIEYAEHDRRRLLQALGSAWGMVLVAGPVGCGKTTTLYACISHLTRPENKVISVEDPVEYVLPGVQQVQVNPRAGVTFSSALRAILRADPDVVLVGEIRDQESLNVCCQAALTGHLVLTTLHTDRATQAIVRLIDVGLDPFLVGEATRLVLAQRLVRRICDACGVPEAPSPVELERARHVVGGSADWPSSAAFRRPVGCTRCFGTGYRGRNVIAETLVVDDEFRQALRLGHQPGLLEAAAIRGGMRSMAADGIQKAARGMTTLDEIFRVLAGQMADREAG